MVRFFERLNTPWAFAAALAFVLVVDGFFFYHYLQRLEQDNTTTTIVDVAPAATEDTIGSWEPEPGNSENLASPVEGQEERAIEEELAVPREAPTSPPAREETGVVDAVRVVVSVSGTSSWLRVQEDRQIVLDQVVEPGFSREFVADRAVSIWAGNAGAVRVEVDGRNLGFLGAQGEVTTGTFTT